MSLDTFKAEQELPVSSEKAWDFLSSPENLKIITPDRMGFVITSEFKGEKMYPGMIISYTVKPILGIKMKWVTEITHVQEPVFFVDEQRFGPYKFWHHKHFLESIKGGVKMTDIIHYKLPFWFIGDLVNSLIVRKELKKIFDYRQKKLEEIFGVYKEPVSDTSKTK